jgi:hypothetical protein
MYFYGQLFLSKWPHEGGKKEAARAGSGHAISPCHVMGTVLLPSMQSIDTYTAQQ